MDDRDRPLRRVFGRVAIVAAVVGVTMLGNLRLQASEVGDPLSTRAVGAGVLATHASGDPASAKPTWVPVDEHPAAADDARLVPAIYAWDKDVQFVYFRHVSKWM